MGEHYGRTASGELIGPYDTVVELSAELADVERIEWLHILCVSGLHGCVNLDTHPHPRALPIVQGRRV